MNREQIDKILAGDVTLAARLMRGIEDEQPDAIEVLESLYLNTGQAHIVGIAGAPGAGKSTLLGTQIANIRQRGLTVGVVAVDPTSPFTGGAVLGDRIRMLNSALDDGVFIRSLASRGWKGGLSRATVNTVHVMDAMGKDIIFVEAVGSGQGDVDVARVADTTIIVLTPGMGDDIQMMKAGILEVADIFVINKSDQTGASRLKSWLEAMLQMKTSQPGDWIPGIILTEATTGRGTAELTEAIFKHRDYLRASGELARRRKVRARLELLTAIESSLQNRIESMDKGFIDRLVDDLVARKTNPRSAAALVINPPGKG